MSMIHKLRSWWQARSAREGTPLEGDAPAWLASLVLHLAFLIALAFFSILIPVQRRVILSAMPVREDDEATLEEFRFSVEPLEEVGALGDGSLDAARPAALVEVRDSRVQYELEPVTPLGEMRVLPFDRTILEGPRVTENLMVKGAGSVGTTGADGAVDRITHEILLSLEERPTLVVWLFDQSGSLKEQREAIARRFDRVYDELGVIREQGSRVFKQHRETPLLTTVASFGRSIHPLTRRPTDDLEEVKAAVRAIDDDQSGDEYVFQAVSFVANKFRQQWLQSPKRNVMIVVFTDEAGDDVQALDSAVEVCQKYHMPVYVVGVPAPFGREQAYVKYVDPDPSFDQSLQWLPVHQGPESLLPELLQLGFAGQSEHDAPLDSGFGPFGLCRLTYETGGLYFVVHPNREIGRRISPWETAAMTAYISQFFDPRLMRSYRPDYVSVDQYHRLLSENEACAALVEAAALSWTAPMEDIQLRFEKESDSQLARELSMAQRAAARIEPRLNRLVEILRRGEPSRPQVTKPRWQAGFDLALGRALAVKVRTEGYNAVLAEAKQGKMFRDERNDTWVLYPSGDVIDGIGMERDAADAREYLRRVVEDHAGTPWAALAERELGQPLGWKWTESFSDVAGRIRRARELAAAAREAMPPRAVPVAPPKPHRDPPAL